jgi:hypothetical protein
MPLKKIIIIAEQCEDVQRSSKANEAQTRLHQLSLYEISTYFKVPVSSLVKGIAEACQVQAGQAAKGSLLK